MNTAKVQPSSQSSDLLFETRTGSHNISTSQTHRNNSIDTKKKDRTHERNMSVGPVTKIVNERRRRISQDAKHQQIVINDVGNIDKEIAELEANMISCKRRLKLLKNKKKEIIEEHNLNKSKSRRISAHSGDDESNNFFSEVCNIIKK